MKGENDVKKHKKNKNDLNQIAQLLIGIGTLLTAIANLIQAIKK